MSKSTDRADESLSQLEALLSFKGIDDTLKSNASDLRCYIKQARDIYGGREAGLKQ